MNPINKILLGLGAGIALVLMIAVIGLYLLNAHLRVELAESQANDTACHITNDDFRAKALQQDQAIAALKTAAEARTRRAAQAEQAAQKTAAVYQADATRIARQKMSGGDCAAARKLFDDYRVRNK